MLVIPPTIGVILILGGIALFIVDLSVTNHGLPTAGGIFTLLAGGLALFGAGVPYSGVLLGTLVVVAILVGGGALRGMGFFAGSRREASHHRQGGDDRRGRHREEPRGGELFRVGVRARRAVEGRACLRSRGNRPSKWRAHDRCRKQGEGGGFRRGRGGAGNTPRGGLP